MKKLTTSILFSILFVAGFTVSTQAQSQFGINLRAGVPIGDFADYAGFGMGGGLSYNYMVNDNFTVGLDVGQMTFLENDASDFATGSSVVIPIIANARYMFGESAFKPLIGIGLGYTMVEQTTTFRIPGNSNQVVDVRDFDGAYNGFTVVPHVGFSAAFNESTSFIFALDYSYILNEAEVPELTDSGNPVTGGPNVIVIDPYSYVGINIGMMYTFGE